MSYTMCSRITFPATEHRDEMKLHFVTSVTVKSSWKMLTSTAEIVMPRMVQAFGKRSLFDRFKPGDPVTVELGYNAGYVKEFEGYILNVGQGVPVTVTCEDEMYMLKRKAVSYSKRSVTLARLLADVCAGYEVDTPFGDTELGAVRYSNVAASAVLEDVKKKTGLSCWFEGKVLHCGNPYSDNAQRPEIGISLERNAVSQDLQRTDNDFEVTVLAILKGGRKMEAKAGTKGAQSVNLNYNVKDEKVTVEALKEVAERYYEGLKKQRYRGGIELFGIPVARHGDVIDLTSEITPEMNGKYLVEAVTKTFSDNATYRQKLDLGGRVT